MATPSSVLAWRIPGLGEPGGLPSMGSHRVGHDWSDLAAAADSWTMFCVSLYMCVCILCAYVCVFSTCCLSWSPPPPSPWIVYCGHFPLWFFFKCLSEVSEVAQSCLTLCDPMDYSLPACSVHGIFQARVPEWYISFSRGSSQPWDWTPVFHIADRRFTAWATTKLWVPFSNSFCSFVNKMRVITLKDPNHVFYSLLLEFELK